MQRAEASVRLVGSSLNGVGSKVGHVERTQHGVEPMVLLAGTIVRLVVSTVFCVEPLDFLAELIVIVVESIESLVGSTELFVEST